MHGQVVGFMVFGLSFDGDKSEDTAGAVGLDVDDVLPFLRASFVDYFALLRFVVLIATQNVP